MIRNVPTPTNNRGVARIIEQGFPAFAPPTRGVWGHAPPRKCCKNGFCEVVSSGFRQLKISHSLSSTLSCLRLSALYMPKSLRCGKHTCGRCGCSCTTTSRAPAVVEAELLLESG